MKVLVPIKRVIDYNVKIRVNSEGSAVETNTHPNESNQMNL